MTQTQNIPSKYEQIICIYCVRIHSCSNTNKLHLKTNNGVVCLFVCCKPLERIPALGYIQRVYDHCWRGRNLWQLVAYMVYAKPLTYLDCLMLGMNFSLVPPMVELGEEDLTITIRQYCGLSSNYSKHASYRLCIGNV